MTEREELKPCPACGDEDGLGEVLVGEFKMEFFVNCLDCDTYTDFFDTEREAIAAWNRRDEG